MDARRRLGEGAHWKILAHIRPRSLRFQRLEEVNFQRSRQRDVVLGLIGATFLLGLFIVVGVVPLFTVERKRPDKPISWTTFEPRTLYFGGFAFLMTTTCVLLVACIARLMCGCLKAVNFEYPAVAWCVQVIVTGWVCNKFHSVAFFHESPDAVWNDPGGVRGAEVMSLLGTTCAVSATAVAVPIRAHILWVVPFACVISYPIIVAVVGSSMPTETVRICFLLTATCAFAHYGTWRHERDARRKWRAIQEATDRDQVVQALEAMSWMSCDVIVRLGADLRVVESNKRLNSFFGQQLQGRCLRDIFVDDDVERYDAALQKACATGEIQSMPATFDLPAAQLRVQLAVAFVNGRSTHYVLGVSQVEHAPKVAASGSEALDPIVEEANDVSSRNSEARPPDAASEAATDATERVFLDIERLCGRWAEHGRGSMRAALEHIAEIGVREHWFVGTSELGILEPRITLGSGGFGHVVLGIFRGAPVAIKVPRAAAVPSTTEFVAPLCNEIRVLRRVRHSNIVAFHGAAIDPRTGELAMIFELVEGCNMRHFIFETHSERAKEARATPLTKVLLDVCGALMYLHSLEPCVVHGDVKCENINVSVGPGGVAKAVLLDFGLSRLMTARAKPLGGTKAYMAPEIFQRSAIPLRPAPSADIYSFGVLVHFAMSGVAPERSFDANDLRGRFSRLLWPEGALKGAECRPLVQECLRTQPQKRPSIKDVRRILLRWVEEALLAGAQFTDFGRGVACQLADTLEWDQAVKAIHEAEVMRMPMAGDASLALDVEVGDLRTDWTPIISRELDGVAVGAAATTKATSCRL